MKTWRDIQRKSFTKLSELTNFLELSDENLAHIDFSPRFPLLLPRRLAEKIPKNSLNHPIGLQFIPLLKEKNDQCGFVADPLGEESFVRVTNAALHKYEGRVLLLTSGACAMHCRYCFRQNFTYESKDKQFINEIEYIQNDPTIHEVILSGGDPLSLSDELLGNLLNSLNQIPHVKIIRFHTRFPIGIPERITDEFLTLLKQSQKQITFIVHLNCIEELDDDITHALKQIARLGIPILTQTVLARGVNNTANQLRSLFLGCITRGILPYYLHQLDRVQGAAHFEVPEMDGHTLLEEVRKSVPGYALPTYVREIASRKSKTPLQLLP